MGSSTIGGGATSAQVLAAEERREKALDLRLRGWTYREIGQELGVSESTALRDIQRMMEEAREARLESAEAMFVMELRRLDMLWKKSMELVELGCRAAIMDALRVSESRRKLLGMDGPQRIELIGGASWATVEEAQRAIEDMSDDELQRLAARQLPGPVIEGEEE